MTGPNCRPIRSMKLYNTLTHDVQDFAPADGKTVKMYVCGVTPYSSTHVGHAFSYVAFDTLRRYLEFLGFDVRHVQNFTDVDDKIIQRAQEQGIDPDDLAEQFIDDFYRTMDALNIQRADIYPRATQEIGPIIETIQTLVDNGSAYPAGGDMFFRVTKKDDYGKLSHRTLDGMQAGSRIEIDENKEHPMDFVLWKGARPGEPSWESPWGPGRPGWHIECTAMAMTYLGATLDIHGGGPDLPPPRERDRPERGFHRRDAVLPVLGAQRPAPTGRRQDEQVPGQPGVCGRSSGELHARRHTPVFPELPLPQPPELLQRGLRRHGA